MSRRDPGAANGGAVREPGRCRCGWLEPFHIVLPGGGRGGFPAAGCRNYRPVPSCCRCDPKLCATDDTGQHCADQSCGVCLHGCPATDTPCCREETP